MMHIFSTYHSHLQSFTRHLEAVYGLLVFRGTLVEIHCSKLTSLVYIATNNRARVNNELERT
jgi:hypothetical protein